jgi:DNA mismatch repair protein MutS2
MNAHALGVLELPRALGLVADRSVSPLGAERVRSLSPTTERIWIERELGRVEATRALIDHDRAWAPEAVPDLAPALVRLRLEGTIWSGLEHRSALALLAGCRRTRDALSDAARPALSRAVLGDIRDRLPAAHDRESMIESAIDDDGAVRDNASPHLRKLRRELRGAESALVALLERIMTSLDPHQQVVDGSVTVRDGRFVIPVRRDARRVLGGIVHGASATGATLFVEPPQAVEAANRIRELEGEERSEVERILRELTESLRPLHSSLGDGLEAMTELDSLYARARFANDFACAPADLGAPGDGFVIFAGRHPLLVAQGLAVVPFDLTMSGGERTLLVSGPNTGGKTVLLKAIALCSVLAQCGVPAPVGPGSRVAIFDEIFADVGDEQSIQASLSTFSAHVKNLGEILAFATPSSLVLIDELGSGTDPLEGGALGAAVLEELTKRRTLTLATTHLGALKELATEVPGVVNASLQFDAAQLAPTYKLVKGIPGRSYGLSIARRLALPQGVLDRAEARLPESERDLDALLTELQRRESALAEQEQAVSEAGVVAQALADRANSRERSVRERERELERQSRQEARRYLLNARAQIEQTVRELRASASNPSAMADEIRHARQRVEHLAAEQTEALAWVDSPSGTEPPADEQAAAPVSVGDFVEVPGLGGRAGRLLDIRDGDAVVAVGSIKMRVPALTLRRSAQAAPAEIVPVAAEAPEVTAPIEIDVRGLRVAEVDEVVMHAIDAAVRADLGSLRIIHGKGTGALRERVAEMLQKDTRVAAARLGAWNEGGAGVTVAELR